MQKSPPLSSFLGIKHWPTWIGIFLLSVIAWMPFPVRMKIGAMLGRLTCLLGKERRYITAVNIAICFPELNAAEQRELVKNAFIENGIGLIETVTGWVRKQGSFKNQTTLIGLDKLEEAQARGKGILLIGGHYSTLDFGANLLSLFHPFSVTYRPHRNALFDAFMLRGRLSNCNGVFDRNDIRGAFRHLKQGKTLWYAPDQDYGPDHAVYAPFFGRPAATITAGSRFAAFNGSPVFLVRQHRIGRSKQYEIEFVPFPDDFPSGDDVHDATVINGMLEAAIRKYPAQYLWMHKRFKTQPGGKPESPYIDIATPNSRLTERQFEEMIAGAQTLPARNGIVDYTLVSGLHLRKYPGIIGKRFYHRHPAKIFDRRAKDLRMHGISSVTVDNFFRIPARGFSAVTWFAPAGSVLSDLPQDRIDLPALARFIARLHDKGFSSPHLRADRLSSGRDGFAVLNPEDFTFQDSPVSLATRRNSVRGLMNELHLDDSAGQTLATCYAEAAGLSDEESMSLLANG